MNASRGFTLVEVLVALVVVALALIALTRTAAGQVAAFEGLRERGISFDGEHTSRLRARPHDLLGHGSGARSQLDDRRCRLDRRAVNQGAGEMWRGGRDRAD